jgi:hypothetical protein
MRTMCWGALVCCWVFRLLIVLGRPVQELRHDYLRNLLSGELLGNWRHFLHPLCGGLLSIGVKFSVMCVLHLGDLSECYGRKRFHWMHPLCRRDVLDDASGKLHELRTGHLPSKHRQFQRL